MRLVLLVIDVTQDAKDLTYGDFGIEEG